MKCANYFELLKAWELGFDPPETDMVVIQRAIDDWKTVIDKQMANEANESGKRRFRELAALHPDMKAVLSNPSSRKAEAESYKKQVLEDLNKVILLYRRMDKESDQVSMARVRGLSKQFRLAMGTVKGAFEALGYEVVSAAVAKVSSIIGNNSEMEEKFSALRAIGESRLTGSSQVYTFFELLAVLERKTIKDANEYFVMDNDRIMDIINRHYSSYHDDHSEYSGVMRNLFSIAATYVFNTTENRQKYRNYCEMHKIQEDLDAIRAAPEGLRTDIRFAEMCIKRIQELFPDEETALAIYNDAANLTHDPYVRESLEIFTVCKQCGLRNRHSNLQEAHAASCAGCKAALYMACPNPSCKEQVARSKSFCNHCNFFIDGIQYFDTYYKQVQDALERMDFGVAETAFHNAKQADPSRKELVALEKLKKEKLGQFERPLSDIKQLMDQREFVAAQHKLQQLQARENRLNLAVYQKQIEGELLAARTAFERKPATGKDAIRISLEILEQVRDFEPAREFLRNKVPLSPKRITAEPDPALGTISLQWEPADDFGVRYHLVRKEGGIPGTLKDGKMLLEADSNLSFLDQTAVPGTWYGYGVFAVRMDAHSQACGTRTILLSELNEEHLRMDVGSGRCTLSWILPPNCLGVRILRARGGTPALQQGGATEALVLSSGTSYQDTGLENSVRYGYRLQTRWNDGSRDIFSQGRTLTALPMLAPDPPIIAASGKGTQKRIIWQKQEGTNALRFYQVNQQYQSGDRIAMANLPEIGPALGTARLDDSDFQFSMKPMESIRVIAVIENGDYAIAGNTISLSSVPDLEWDEQRFFMEHQYLNFGLKNLSSATKRLHYFCGYKNNDEEPAPWRGVEQIAQMSVISYAQFADQDCTISVRDLPAGKDIYLTVIASYTMKKATFYSKPLRKRVSSSIKFPIWYDIDWERKLFRKTREGVLTITTTAQDIPECVLCAHRRGATYFGPEDGYVVELVRVTRQANTKSYRIPFGSRKLDGIPEGALLKLFVNPREQEGYRLPAFRNADNIHVP